MNEFEDFTIETIQNETKEKMGNSERVSVSYGIYIKVTKKSHKCN